MAMPLSHRWRYCAINRVPKPWMLEGILSSLPADDPRRPALTTATEAHRRAGLAAVTGEHYEGGHWLGSFAVYLTTQRGIKK